MKLIKLFSIIAICFSLFACSIIGDKQDSAPVRKPDVANIPDAIPQDEPRSKYGNPAHYEVFGKRYYTLNTSRGYHEKGIASWYGTKFHGRRTSSGETYDMYAMTAAHKTLPLPSYVEVTNLNNGRKVIVKVNDRGPFHGNRLIDLSYSAATKLGIIGKGTGLVEVRAITAGEAPVSTAKTTSATYPSPAGPVGLYLQVGAFSTSASAEQLKLKLQQQIGDAVLIVPFKKPQGVLYRVRVGPLANVEYGDTLASQLVELGFNDAHIVVE
ncbi:MAG: septal ring lytic transglycosylase RlpA family protein [Methylophagaceae bacterium]